MGSRFPSHQLSNGLYVSGRPEQPKERATTMSSTAMPYTGGDIKKSGELGKMFDLSSDGSKSRKSGPIPGAPTRTGSFGGAASHSGPIHNPSGRVGHSSSGHLASAGPGSIKKNHSGPLNKHGEPLKKSSGPQAGGIQRQNSGPIPPVLPTTGLITSGPLNSSGAPRKFSGPLEPTGSMKFQIPSVAHLQAVTTLSREDDPTFVSGWGRKAVTGYIARYPDNDLRTAKNGQYVKVSGVITCGSVPLQSSFHKVPRCVYTSTTLYERKGRFTWDIRLAERHVVDFYISDFQSGLRALVKTGYGATVTAYVDDTAVINVNSTNKDASSEFIKWLRERNLSMVDHSTRLKEGYIKEGSTVSVMGVIQRNNNMLMIVPPSEPVSTGCLWSQCVFPSSLDGVVIRCEDTSDTDVIPV
ncbi:hypothetical protein MLD38_004969 [Melastoma candidum]|uniref:Uncharacterized protein n=1 Tax=Melastoma candidum TaxID=119954 RepID=A0ACB9SAP5_9MYRT|nr:hypothetical protein MLD38_004969 [Melastoma candidum]